MTAYLIGETGVWTDIPEARPRVRAKLKKDGEPAELTVDEDGKIEHSSAIVIDTYEGAKYAAVRAEGEAVWADKDRLKKRNEDKEEKVKDRG